MSQEAPLDWTRVVLEEARNGRLLALLLSLPRARWSERSRGAGNTLLHMAGCGPNVDAAVALIVHGGLDINRANSLGRSPLLTAIKHGQTRVLEVLCAAGADMTPAHSGSLSPLDTALVVEHGPHCAHVLLANGVRLKTTRRPRRITPELEAFERGVLRCRVAVVAMLRVKRAGKLWMWDKFLLAELALSIWATRFDKGWQK